MLRYFEWTRLIAITDMKALLRRIFFFLADCEYTNTSKRTSERTIQMGNSRWSKKKNNNTQNTHIHLFVYALNWTCSDSNFHRTIEYILVHLRIMFNAHDKLLLFHWFVFVVHKFFFCLLFFSIHFDLCFLLLWMRIRFVVVIQNIDENEKNEEKKNKKK